MKKILYCLHIVALVGAVALPRFSYAAPVGVSTISLNNLNNTVRVVTVVSRTETPLVAANAISSHPILLSKTSPACIAPAIGSVVHELQNFSSINLNQSADCFSAVTVGAIQAQQQISVAPRAIAATVLSVVMLGIISAPHIVPYQGASVPSAPVTAVIAVAVLGAYGSFHKLKQRILDTSRNQFISSTNSHRAMLRC